MPDHIIANLDHIKSGNSIKKDASGKHTPPPSAQQNFTHSKKYPKHPQKQTKKPENALSFIKTLFNEQVFNQSGASLCVTGSLPSRLQSPA